MPVTTEPSFAPNEYVKLWLSHIAADKKSSTEDVAPHVKKTNIRTSGTQRQRYLTILLRCLFD